MKMKCLLSSVLYIGTLGLIVFPVSGEVSSRPTEGTPAPMGDYGYRKVSYDSIHYPSVTDAQDKIDPVAYFTQGKVTKGKSNYYYIWKGKKWYFSGRDHAELFIADPYKYQPQYDGYCAYAASRGDIEPGNPKNWTIIEGKLYLSKNSVIQEKWEEKPNEYIRLADQKWPELKKKLFR